jgi:hypothetical protein
VSRVKLIYSPEGGEPQQFDFEPMELLASEAELIESEGAGFWDSYMEFYGKFITGNIRARRVLLWMFLRRTNPTLELGGVQFRVNEFLNVTDDDDEELDGELGKDTESEDSPTDSPSATTA